MTSTTDKQVIQKKLTFTGVDVHSVSGALIKAGSSSAKIVCDVANTKFMEFRLDCGATSGDNRAMYLRLYLSGAGGGGESLRVFTSVDDVAAGTAHGAHISLNFQLTGSVTGLGIASRNTLHIPNVAMSGGTYAVIQAEMYNDGADSDISGVTQSCFIRIVNDGNASGIAVVDANVPLMELVGFTPASGALIDTDISTHTAYAGIPIDIDGTGIKYLAVVSD